MQKFMISDPSDAVRQIAGRFLSEFHFAVSEAENAAETLTLCQAEMPHYLLIDASMDGALDVIATIRATPGGEHVKIYYCLSEVDLRTLMAGKKAGATDFLLKPFDEKIMAALFKHCEAAA